MVNITNSKMLLHFNNKPILTIPNSTNEENIHNLIISTLYLEQNDYYLLANGKKVTNNLTDYNVVHIIPKLCGGKGGFGSMLRAIGAQIEKTTNREACRDLSGRRLRDINEEKRLKAWIEKQADKEKEDEGKKQKKLEKLMQKPRHEFKDEVYDKERAELPDRLEDAITQGLTACASTSSKRKSDNSESEKPKKKKKKALWIDDELEDLTSSDDGNSSSEEESTVKSLKQDAQEETTEIVEEKSNIAKEKESI